MQEFKPTTVPPPCAIRKFHAYESHAEFISPMRLCRRVAHRGDAFVIATGSAGVAEVAIPGLSEAGYVTATKCSMCAVHRRRSRYWAAAWWRSSSRNFFRIGTKVTMLQRGATLLSDMDQDVGQALASAFEDEGIEVLTGVAFDQVTSSPTGKTVHFRQNGVSHTRSAESSFFMLWAVVPT